MLSLISCNCVAASNWLSLVVIKRLVSNAFLLALNRRAWRIRATAPRIRACIRTT
jgi:hypothetical protein